MSTDHSIPERLAVLEATYPDLKADVAEIKTDVKALLAAHNRQTVAAKLVALIWRGLLAVGSALGGALVAKGH
jgi:hypothetical protein